MTDLKLIVNNVEKPALVIDPADNVAIALVDLRAGDLSTIRSGEHIEKVQVIEDVPFGHKFSLRALKENEGVFKYGEEIGKMKSSIEKGGWIHSHNMYCDRGRKIER